MQNVTLILVTLTQLLHALASSTAQQNPATYMPVPSDNVTVSGLMSDGKLAIDDLTLDPAYIKPVDPRGVVVPSSTDTYTVKIFTGIGTNADFNVVTLKR